MDTKNKPLRIGVDVEIHHRQAARPRRDRCHHLLRLPPPPLRHPRHHHRHRRRGARAGRRPSGDHHHHRLGRPAACQLAWRAVYPGGHCQQDRHRAHHPAHRCRHRAGRRGRQDHLLRQRHRAAHERHLRRRHGRVHRPDGNPARTRTPAGLERTRRPTPPPSIPIA